MLFFTPDADRSKRIEIIYNKYCKFMYKVAYDILKEKYYAEDAVQQSFIRIINNLDKIGDIESQKTRNFIGLITRNISIDIYNSRKKQSDAIGDDITENPDNDLSAIIIKKETVANLKKYINELKPIYYIPLVMKAQGYSVNEIADTLGINSKTVQKRIERARAVLYKKMREDI